MSEKTPAETAKDLFNEVLSGLKENPGEESVVVPREVIWLCGAPGAGKGTNTPYILERRDIKAEPVIMSDLLKADPGFQEIINSGKLVGDADVMGILFRHLVSSPELEAGVIVDGYPRTEVQVESLKLLQAWLKGIAEKKNKPEPVFRFVVLSVSRETSLARQAYRGEQAQKENEERAKRGEPLIELRSTDLDKEKMSLRYDEFVKQDEAIKSAGKVFPYHNINAEGGYDEVKSNVVGELPPAGQY